MKQSDERSVDEGPPALPADRTPDEGDEDKKNDFTLIYEEDSMRRRDLLSSAVQTIDGARFCGIWVTQRKTMKVRERERRE